MARSKLRAALDNHKGRNIKLEKQRKKEKAARKRKEKNNPTAEDIDDDDSEDGGVEIDEQVVREANGKPKKGKKMSTEELEWETEQSEGQDASEEDDDDEDEMPERPAFDLSKLEDSDSEGSSDEDAKDDEEEDQGDIPLSDIESLASEDKGDIIPHQRLTINNTAALTTALNRICLPYSKLSFSEHQTITSDAPTKIPDVEDDLNRELAFYKQSLAAVKDAREKLKKEGVPFSRPADYFAEMVKSDEHMGKIKQKLIDEAAGKKAAAEARRQRDLKKFGKQVQVAKLQERAKERKDTVDKINLLKRKRQGADLTSTNEDDLFDVALDDAAKISDRGRSSDVKPNFKRQKKDAKYGFGGKKRHAKSNDTFSTNDARGFSHKKAKAGGASKRLGKGRRAKRN
ncbi:Ebp2-domain-containing protein [Lojkania enalia]|uniref:Ebp2-domain-containing protein n=1 Tax=Lojkania enalia TaxID=147567 RepID=A0A9P4N6A0_9PLEO|nr:Ebp2-domain-containing protein [Didymosphaeria enalia]